MPDNSTSNPQNQQPQGYPTDPYQQQNTYPTQPQTDYGAQQQAPYDPNLYNNQQPVYPPAADQTQAYASAYQPTDYGAQQPQAYPNSTGYDTLQPQQASYDPNSGAAYSPATDQYSQSSQQYDPNLASTQQLPAANTFEEKKGGNKVFFIISSVVIVALLAAAGVLVYLNFFQGTNASSSSSITSSSVSSSSSSSVVTIDTSKTGGANTPASKARINSETVLPDSWLLQKMRSANPNNVDANGKCLTVSFCGENADFDKDGATNIEEYNFGTDPLNPDTDSDGISDGDELFVYFSDPIKKDTDTDTFSDGDELASCYDMNSTAKDKMNSSRLSQISQSASLRKITDPTITTLKTKGKAVDAVDGKGYSEVTCGATTSSSSSVSSTSSASSSSSVR